jgi:hypothetical protein
MPWIDSLDWTSLNALRRYPLREGSSALSTDGNFSIPDTLIVDLTLCASSDITERFYISRIFNKIETVVITVSDSSNIVAGSFEISQSGHYQDKDYYLDPSNLYVGANGKITIGSLDELKYQPAGIFDFLISSTEFEPRTIVPGLQGVDRITFINNTGEQYNVSGNVTVVSRNNIVFSEENEQVLFDAGDDLGLNKPCSNAVAVQRINGVVPDPATGNISLLGINCLNIQSTTQYTLDMEDTCCTPCSGCNDLEELTTRLTSLENKFLELKGSYNNVNAQLSGYLSTINSNCACP